MALSVLRANDYQMTSLESNGTCALERVVGFLSNSPNASKPLFENAQAHGHLLCHVETHDILPESKIKAVPHGDYKTILFAENVRCTIYPRGADKDKQVADLKSALTELVERSPGG